MDAMRMEAFLRVCVILLLLTTACLVRFDSQTSLIFPSYSRTASFRDMNALFVLVFIDIAAAGYNLIQLVIRCMLISSPQKQDMRGSYKHLAWFSFLLDQAVVYMIFAANSASLLASVYALNGEHHLFWMKLCSKFNRFCTQIGGALLCSYVAFLLMAVVSFLSAYGLFRHYSPKTFLVLK
ncbi:putative casparian strip membrane protein [Helianthus annuus]|nr:putative casparian strip membrane protein [Helianthus annuus]KAJ0865132.1 putative casparian strip membrane protein [Helianthus annuus]